MRMIPIVAATALVLGFVSAAAAYPAGVVVPCQYPHGWNSTDASRAVRGVPNGRDHQCLVTYDQYRANSGWGWRYE
jgi:hypothetical protein